MVENRRKWKELEDKKKDAKDTFDMQQIEKKSILNQKNYFLIILLFLNSVLIFIINI